MLFAKHYFVLERYFRIIRQRKGLVMQEMIGELIQTAYKAKEAGLVVSSSGNISVRLSENTFAISSSGSYLGDLDSENISVCYLDNDDTFERAKPSIETPLHRSIYVNRPGINAVLHFQSLYATVIACAKEGNFNLNFIPEIPAYIKSIRTISYFNPGTAKLAQSVAEEIKNPDCNILVLDNHGQIAVGKDLKEMLRNAEFFEFACRIACQGIKLKTYDEETIEILRGYGGDNQ